MFFHMTLDRHIVLHPAHFGPRMREILYERLRTEVRGCLRPAPGAGADTLASSARAGGGHMQRAVRLYSDGDGHQVRRGSAFHCPWLSASPLACALSPRRCGLCVSDPSLWWPPCLKKGVIQDTTAFAKFHVTYTCIVFRPFKGEVLDCIVTSVNKVRRPSKAASTLFLGLCGAVDTPFEGREGLGGNFTPERARECVDASDPVCRLVSHHRWGSLRRRGRCKCLSAAMCVAAAASCFLSPPHTCD